MFTVCIKRHLGEMDFGEVEKTMITDQTNKIKEDQKIVKKHNLGKFTSYWNTKQHTQYLYHYHLVKNLIQCKIQSEQESVLKVNGTFSLNEQLTDHIKNVIK